MYNKHAIFCISFKKNVVEMQPKVFYQNSKI